MRDISTKAIVANGTEKGIIEALGIQPNDVVIVSFGEDLAASILITLHLTKLGVKDIIVKVSNEEHKVVLERVGATEVLIPEKDMAEKLARSLVSPNLLDYIPLGEDFMVGEIGAPGFLIGRTVEEVNLRARYNVNVIAIRDTQANKVAMLRSHYKIKPTDVLVVIGRAGDIEKLK